MTMKSTTSVVTLLGDVVDSRASGDRPGLHRALTAGLDRVDAVIPSIGGLRVTVGDEFQGSYTTVGHALDVALRIRLTLLPGVDVRVGIGRGEVVDLDTERGLQDGPGWWAARAAIEQVEAASRSSALRALRTAYRSEPPAPGDEAISAALVCQDQLIGSLSERALRLLAGLLDGASQADLADREGISPSAVSQQVRSNGIGAILHAHAMLRRLP